MATDNKTQIGLWVSQEDKDLLTRYAEEERESVGQFLLKSALYRIKQLQKKESEE